MWIMVAGPYATNAANAAQRAENLRALNHAAVALDAAGSDGPVL